MVNEWLSEKYLSIVWLNKTEYYMLSEQDEVNVI